MISAAKIFILDLPSMALVPLLIWIPVARASEIVLRPTARPEGPIVRLGDLAEIRGIDTTRLRELESLPLMPTPAPGTVQYLRRQQVRELLVAHDQDLADHFFRGADQVRIGTDPPMRPLARRRLPEEMTATRRAELSAAVENAILESLCANASPDPSWQVAFELTESQYGQLSEANTPITAHGGEAPWTGLQYLTVRFKTPAGPVHLPLEAHVAVPEPAVVAIRAIPRGTIVRQTDVALRRIHPTSKQGHSNSVHDNNRPIRQLDQVVGTETKRSIRPGEVFTRQVVQWPLVVTRGETVKITARMGGVRVCTHARARESGSRGDLIVVESLEDRERIVARVVGLREVEVFANPVAASDDARPASNGTEFLDPIRSQAGSAQVPNQPSDRPRPGPVLEDGLDRISHGLRREESGLVADQPEMRRQRAWGTKP